MAAPEQIRVAFVVEGKNDLRIVSVDTPLHSIIQELIQVHKLKKSAEEYALVYQKDGNKVKQFKIVTEKDRVEMNAKIVELVDSPAASTARIVTEIKKVEPDPRELSRALGDLKRMAVDSTFARAFFHKSGLQLLMSDTAAGKFRTAEQLEVVLESILLLVEHLVDEDSLRTTDFTQDFIKQLADLTTREGDPAYSLSLRSALSLLTTLVRESEESRSTIDMVVALPNLISLLANVDPRVKLRAITLINTLLQHATPERRGDMVRTLQERPARTLILEHLLPQTGGTGTLQAPMAHQLYLLQHHTLSQVLPRLHTSIEPQDGQALNKIKELRATAFDTGSPTIKNNTRYAQDHKKLGFDNIKDPSLDFLATPPGVLALDCMDHFAKTQQENFMKVVLENSCRADSHACPFARSSIELVRQLAVLLGVGQEADPDCTSFHEMLFKAEHPFEEFYCHCVLLLNKTWRDMRATREDFDKVFDVVREQIEGSLNPAATDPKRAADRPKTFEQFRLGVRSYVDISRRWQADARSRKAWDDSEPVRELKEHLRPEVRELVERQRANFMVEGTRFQRYKKSGEVDGNGKTVNFRYVKLHPNLKTIYVGDWNSEKSLPTIEELEPWLQVADVTLLTEGNCPFLKGCKKPEVVKRSFCLQGENTSLDLVAPDAQTFNYWVDGVKCLKQQPMTSSDYQRELEVLLDMDVRLRLLDLEGLELPAEAPRVPPPPPSFDFAAG